MATQVEGTVQETFPLERWTIEKDFSEDQVGSSETSPVLENRELLPLLASPFQVTSSTCQLHSDWSEVFVLQTFRHRRE